MPHFYNDLHNDVQMGRQTRGTDFNLRCRRT